MQTTQHTWMGVVVQRPAPQHHSTVSWLLCCCVVDVKAKFSITPPPAAAAARRHVTEFDSSPAVWPRPSWPSPACSRPAHTNQTSWRTTRTSAAAGGCSAAEIGTTRGERSESLTNFTEKGKRLLQLLEQLRSTNEKRRGCHVTSPACTTRCHRTAPHRARTIGRSVVRCELRPYADTIIVQESSVQWGHVTQPALRTRLSQRDHSQLWVLQVRGYNQRRNNVRSTSPAVIWRDPRII